MVVEFQKNDKTKLTNTINNEYVFIVWKEGKMIHSNTLEETKLWQVYIKKAKGDFARVAWTKEVFYKRLHPNIQYTQIRLF